MIILSIYKKKEEAVWCNYYPYSYYFWGNKIKTINLLRERERFLNAEKKKERNWNENPGNPFRIDKQTHGLVEKTTTENISIII